MYNTYNDVKWEHDWTDNSDQMFWAILYTIFQVNQFFGRKREERMRRVNERREQANREDMESKSRMMRTMEEKSKQADDLKEEKMKEEQEKQRLRYEAVKQRLSYEVEQ